MALFLFQSDQPDLGVYLILMEGMKPGPTFSCQCNRLYHQALTPQVKQIFWQIEEDLVLQSHAPQFTIEQILQ